MPVDVFKLTTPVAVWLSANVLILIAVSYTGPVSTGMGDRVRGSTPGAEKSISVYNQSPRSTKPSHPSVSRHNEY